MGMWAEMGRGKVVDLGVVLHLEEGDRLLDRDRWVVVLREVEAEVGGEVVPLS
jgi:hypothetical protein